MCWHAIIKRMFVCVKKERKERMLLSKTSLENTYFISKSDFKNITDIFESVIYIYIYICNLIVIYLICQ